MCNEDPESVVIVRDDKDPATDLHSARQSYEWRTYQMLEKDQSWTRQRCNKYRVPEILETIHKEMEGTIKSQKRVKKKLWENIPHGYTTLKSKCHHDGNEKGNGEEVNKGIKCQDEGHQHFRRIVSFVKFPTRGFQRMIGRSALVLTNALKAGWSCTNLKESASEVRKMIGEVKKRLCEEENGKMLLRC